MSNIIGIYYTILLNEYTLIRGYVYILIRITILQKWHTYSTRKPHIMFDRQSDNPLIFLASL